ncbi:hypothetical protein A3193_03695 [Candidatus Thiodiazotropha endoloripes]|uniref:tyrosine-type recombinase/integrase n=1 Tax=Candidatus Thiodiazotropha endoloripes TaxID=1818881 RepID=UPI00083D34E5|nr:integrase family protein [Candidatus Thiodiazotropha endoloripes]ODB88007.1 hypothetical protein A3193_03695 [Candidatus Thiodiazotropha endoloripes]
MNINKTFINSLTNTQGRAKELPDKDTFYRDSGLTGFGLKVSKSGVISFIYEGRIKNSRSRRITLGRHPSLPLDSAKDKALETQRLMKAGIDPVQHRIQQKQELDQLNAQHAVQQFTLRELMEDYFKYKPETTERWYRPVLENLFSGLLGRPVRAITAEDIAEIYYQKAIRENHPAQAKKGNRYLKAICNHGLRKEINGIGILDRNPVILAMSQLPAEESKPLPPKERFVNQERLFDFIRAIITECHETARDLLLFLLFTGVRDSEAKKLKWDKVNFHDKTCTVIAKRNKDHTLPMGPLIYAMLLARSTDQSPTGYVFSNRGNYSHIGDLRKQFRKITQKTGIEFSPHDLRRSYATYLEEDLNVSDSQISRLLGHSQQGVTKKHYIKSQATNYKDEASRLYTWITSLGDWSRDSGKGISRLDLENLYEGTGAVTPELSEIYAKFEESWSNDGAAYIHTHLHAFLYRNKILSIDEYDKHYLDDLFDLEFLEPYDDEFSQMTETQAHPTPRRGNE